MLSWYTVSFNTCFILAFSLVKPSLLVIMEYPVLNKEEQRFPCNLFGSDSCNVGTGQWKLPICQYRDLSMILFQWSVEKR